MSGSLLGLLYRADWTRLALAGTVRGAGELPNTTFTQLIVGVGHRSRPQPFPLPDAAGLDALAEPPGTERSLILAPGRRYRVTSSDWSRVVGCDGERAWQWFADLPPDTEVRFDHRPELPVPELLAPAWLLLGYRLTVGARDDGGRAAGDRGHRGGAARSVAGPGRGDVAAMGTGPASRSGHRGHRRRARDRAPPRAVRSRTPDAETDVTEFLSLDVGDSADPSVFTAPEGSFFGDGPGGERPSDRRPVDEAGLAALKMVGGLAAGGLGAAVRYAPKRQADPFAAATAEEPDDAMPDDEPLPGWAAARRRAGPTTRTAGRR